MIELKKLHDSFLIHQAFMAAAAAAIQLNSHNSSPGSSSSSSSASSSCSSVDSSPPNVHQTSDGPGTKKREAPNETASEVDTTSCQDFNYQDEDLDENFTQDEADELHSEDVIREELEFLSQSQALKRKPGRVLASDSNKKFKLEKKPPESAKLKSSQKSFLITDILGLAANNSTKNM
jgi:hypothetical protein